MESEIVVSGRKNATLNRLFERFIAANLLGWLVYLVGSFADSIIGGCFLGEDALAGIEIVSPLISLIYFATYLVSVGSGILHAKAIGKNDFETADRIFSTGFYVSLFVGIVCSLALYLFKEAWLDLYELEGAIREYASEYYDPFIIVGFVMPIGHYFYININDDGGTTFAVGGDIVNTVTNLTLSLLLVGSLGAKGLSISTMVATIASYIIPCSRLFLKSNTLRLRLKFCFKDILNSMKAGSATILSILTVAVIDIVMNYYITVTYGAEYVAPYAIVNFALEIGGALCLVGNTMSNLLSFSIGEGNTKDIKSILSHTKRTALIIGAAFTILFIGLSPLWPTVFGLETQEFIDYTTTASISIGLSFIPLTFLYIVPNFYTCYEKMGISIFAEVLNSFVCPLVCPIVLSTLFQYNGFVIGFAVSNVLAFLIVYVFLLIKNKGCVFYIPETDSKTYSVDLKLNTDSISKSVIKVRDILKENNVASNISNRIQLTLEESLNVTLKNNKRKVFSRVVLDINKERVSMIVKDSGTIFNAIDSDQKVTDLSNYLLVMTKAKINKTINYVACNLNGYHYEFSL